MFHRNVCPQITRHIGEVSHPKRDHVSDAGDGDGDPRVCHGVRHQVLDADVPGRGPLDVVEALDDDEHVVNSNAETQEREDGVDQRVGVVEDGGDASAHDEPEHDTDDTSEREEDPVLYAAQGAEHDAGVGQHQEVATRHQETIKEDCIC